MTKNKRTIWIILTLAVKKEPYLHQVDGMGEIDLVAERVQLVLATLQS